MMEKTLTVRLDRVIGGIKPESKMLDLLQTNKSINRPKTATGPRENPPITLEYFIIVVL